MKKLVKTLLSFLIISIVSCSSLNLTHENTNLPFSKHEKQVDSLLSIMTLDEKIGQMTQADLYALSDTSDITKYFIGSVLSGGSSDPPQNTAKAWADIYNHLQSYALKTRLRIPIIYGIDAVHGHNNVLDAVIFPHNIGLGCTRNPKLVEEAARVTAEEVAATGIDWTFAPCIAVARNERWGRTYESFGETPELVSEMGVAQIKGFQTNDLSGTTSILACVKHYAGDGGTTNGKDQGNTQCDEATFRRLYLSPYEAAIKAGVGSIMVSYSSWNGEKMSQNKYLLTDVLKKEFGFRGFLVSDWAAIDQLGPDYKSDIEKSINAGLDMIMIPFGPGKKNNFIEFIEDLKELVNENKVPLSRIDDAVRRILRVKFEMGIFEHPYTDESLLNTIGSKEHREVARECVRQSLVLLKNKNNVLPLAKKLSKIFVAGKSADDIGNQCGGWTISWQGESGNVTTGGTTILQAIKNVVSKNTQVIYSENGDGAEGANIGIVVVGEKPYAEGHGDREDLSLSKEDLATIEKVKASGIPTLVILISGRPMIIIDALKNCDAFIAAWLPGTEGEGVADVLFGDYNPTGKLSHSWPKENSQLPINYGDSNYNPLFPYGFGLSY